MGGKLELGSGMSPTEGYVHLDIDPKAKDVDIVGDVRALFSPDYNLNDFPDLKQLDTRDGELCLFNEVLAKHFVEHVQWLYQEAMFQWIYTILDYNGKLVIETPNLTWIVKSYLKNKRKKRFPMDDHPQLGTPDDYTTYWVYRIFSGCSLGDYHHCLYDREWLMRLLQKVGFRTSVTAKGDTLKVLAIKPAEKAEKTDEYYKG